jgi:hypothetical protein
MTVFKWHVLYLEDFIINHLKIKESVVYKNSLRTAQ